MKKTNQHIRQFTSIVNFNVKINTLAKRNLIIKVVNTTENLTLNNIS